MHVPSKVQESKRRLLQREEMNSYSQRTVGEEGMHIHYVSITLKRDTLTLGRC